MTDAQPSHAGEHLPLSEQQRIDQLCDQFEAVQRNGQRPRIEDFLTKASEQAKLCLLRELIALEVDWWHEVGVLSEIESLRRRFADHLDWIDKACERARLHHGKLGDVSTTGPSNEHDTAVESDDEMPQQIGRYRVERELGRGGFAVVYLAHDTELERQVALKVPRRDRFRSDRDLRRFVQEARHAAQLDHPGIVRIYDVQHDEPSVYIVQQYVSGQDLATMLQQRRLSPPEIAKLLVGVAEAIGFAHRSGLYHRDLKPANILIDENDQPRVVDFGLAVQVTQLRRHRGELAGSYPYMAPEQVRGEVHLLDGRTDIWALGVIMYEMLTHDRPFHGTDEAELFDDIKNRSPRPPREIDPAIPKELVRICLACLAKRAADRYDSTTDLVDDLRRWLTTDLPADETPPARIVPKGLRSFDADDADFFLELLPGPRDREGVPKSIRFWKQRIEETDPNRTFRVGLIYGPSGCGKSSLVQAGLLPRLGRNVLPVYVEATGNDTELRILKSLRHRFPELQVDQSLHDAFRMLRERRSAGDRKVLIVLDQFEQWLHMHGSEDNSQLVEALRQCDGADLQGLVLVRDDFWMAISRFMEQLEVPIEAHNSGAVDLFDKRHAATVLKLIGRVYGRWPEEGEQPSGDQQRFLNRAIGELSQDGKIVCVRLALFADMMQDKDWTPSVLREIGGIGGAFMDETFSAATAPLTHKLHKEAACRVLTELLPETGTDIKGQMRSHQQLAIASRYQDRPADLTTLLRILDQEVRLITPTEPVATSDQPTAKPDSGQQFFQLTHDYLVPSLREWLTREKKKTRPGRADLLLQERAAHWKDKRENQQLPNPVEYAQIAWHVDLKGRKQVDRDLIRTATRYYGLRAVASAVLLVVLVWGSRAAYARIKASELVAALMKASPEKVAASVADLQVYLPWARSALEDMVMREPETDDQRKQRLHARLALVASDETHVAPLVESLLNATPQYLGVIRDVLLPYATQVSESLWQTLHDDARDEQRRFHAGLALAAYEPSADAWRDTDYRFLVAQLLSSFAEYQGLLREALRPIAAQCLAPLEGVFRDDDAAEAQREAAALAMKDFAANDQQQISDLLTVATPSQYKILFPLVQDGVNESVRDMLAEAAATLPPDDMGTLDRVEFGQRRAGAGITLLRLGERERVLPTFDMTNDPEALTQFIFRCTDRGVRAEELLDLLRSVSANAPSPPRVIPHSSQATIGGEGRGEGEIGPSAYSGPLTQRR